MTFNLSGVCLCPQSINQYSKKVVVTVEFLKVLLIVLNKKKKLLARSQ